MAVGKEHSHYSADSYLFGFEKLLVYATIIVQHARRTKKLSQISDPFIPFVFLLLGNLDVTASLRGPSI
jgi:hypothetical protein